jgi:hypothetical protein
MTDWKTVSDTDIDDEQSLEQKGLSPAGKRAIQGETDVATASLPEDADGNKMATVHAGNDVATASLPEDADGNKMATIHAGNEIEKEPSPEGEPRTIYPEGRKPTHPEGWHPGGPEGGGW